MTKLSEAVDDTGSAVSGPEAVLRFRRDAAETWMARLVDRIEQRRYDVPADRLRPYEGDSDDATIEAVRPA
ncbi:hypothetical protein [Amycolatopsis sulphurea]|uniref:hypothetical protein n=1 Tax=Amycolatopsis sulphurea TaxID=76022 RepID=UPI001145F850|nr:hypothetical protein [Amycolatopsis sulphurea]